MVNRNRSPPTPTFPRKGEGAINTATEIPHPLVASASEMRGLGGIAKQFYNLCLHIQDKNNSVVTIHLYTLASLYLGGSLKDIDNAGDSVLPAHNG